MIVHGNNNISTAEINRQLNSNQTTPQVNNNAKDDVPLSYDFYMLAKNRDKKSLDAILHEFNVCTFKNKPMSKEIRSKANSALQKLALEGDLDSVLQLIAYPFTNASAATYGFGLAEGTDLMFDIECIDRVLGAKRGETDDYSEVDRSYWNAVNGGINALEERGKLDSSNKQEINLLLNSKPDSLLLAEAINDLTIADLLPKESACNSMR